MERSGETEICGTHVALLRDADAETSKSTSRRRSIENFLKAADDRTIALCRSANVCALRLMLLKGLEPPPPAFSAASKNVVSTTYKVWVGCITTVETVPDRASLGSILGVDATLPTRWRFVVSSPDSVSPQGIAQERFENEKYKLTF